MKNKIKLYLWLSLSLSLPILAQQPIVDIADEVAMQDNFNKNGYYYKDVQGVLNKFVGTWECEYMENGINKKFVLTLTKLEEFYWSGSAPNYYVDGLVYQYDIYHNNSLFFSSTTFPLPQFVMRSNDKILINMVDYLRRDISFGVTIQYAPVIQQGGGGQERLYFDRATASRTLNRYHRDHPNEPYSSMPTNIFLTRVD
ncbi:MAG: DUF6705 family protein [Flavobacterium sp.]